MLSISNEEERISWARDAMRAVHRKEVNLPLRCAMQAPDAQRTLGIMPGYVGGAIESAGVKMVSLVPQSAGSGVSHAGLFALFSGDSLQLSAIMCGSTLTAMRTSAMSAAATKALARANSRVLGIMGAGQQALFHAHSIAAVFQLEQIIIWSRNSEKSKALAAELTSTLEILCCAVADIESLAGAADIICTVTASKTPILPGTMVRPGTHVNLVGSSHKKARETDHILLQKAEVYVDYLASVRAQAGEILTAIEAGEYEENHFRGEIGALLEGAIKGRSAPDAITVYKSLGVAAQDIFTAKKLLERAEKLGVGALIEF